MWQSPIADNKFCKSNITNLLWSQDKMNDYSSDTALIKSRKDSCSRKRCKKKICCTNEEEEIEETDCSVCSVPRPSKGKSCCADVEEEIKERNCSVCNVPISCCKCRINGSCGTVVGKINPKKKGRKCKGGIRSCSLNGASSSKCRYPCTSNDRSLKSGSSQANTQRECGYQDIGSQGSDCDDECCHKECCYQVCCCEDCDHTPISQHDLNKQSQNSDGPFKRQSDYKYLKSVSSQAAPQNMWSEPANSYSRTKSSQTPGHHFDGGVGQNAKSSRQSSHFVRSHAQNSDGYYHGHSEQPMQPMHPLQYPPQNMWSEPAISYSRKQSSLPHGQSFEGGIGQNTRFSQQSSHLAHSHAQNSDGYYQGQSGQPILSNHQNLHSSFQDPPQNMWSDPAVSYSRKQSSLSHGNRFEGGVGQETKSSRQSSHLVHSYAPNSDGYYRGHSEQPILNNQQSLHSASLQDPPQNVWSDPAISYSRKQSSLPFRDRSEEGGGQDTRSSHRSSHLVNLQAQNSDVYFQGQSGQPILSNHQSLNSSLQTSPKNMWSEPAISYSRKQSSLPYGDPSEEGGGQHTKSIPRSLHLIHSHEPSEIRWSKSTDNYSRHQSFNSVPSKVLGRRATGYPKSISAQSYETQGQQQRFDPFPSLPSTVPSGMHSITEEEFEDAFYNKNN